MVGVSAVAVPVREGHAVAVVHHRSLVPEQAEPVPAQTVFSETGMRRDPPILRPMSPAHRLQPTTRTIENHIAALLPKLDARI